MQVFVAGATGLIGRRLVSELTDRGHGVVGLTRDDAGDRVVDARGGTPRRSDLFDRDSLVDAAAGCDALVRVATAVPKATRTGAGDWAENGRLRREGTRNLLAAADAVGADRYLQESVVWVARRPDGAAFDEDADPNPDRTTESALDAERIADRAASSGVQCCTLRLGWLYGHDAYHTRSMAESLLAGRLPVIGGGLLGREDAELSVVHVDDAARAFAVALDADATGRYHVVDGEPVTGAAFTTALADRLDAPAPRRVPWWVARPFTGPDLVRFMTSPMPTTGDRFRRETGFEPAVPDYRAGLDRTVANWRRTGAIREADDDHEWVADAEFSPEPPAVADGA